MADEPVVSAGRPVAACSRARFAVVVATVDRWDCLVELLVSVAAQSVQPAEVVVVSPLRLPDSVKRRYPFAVSAVVSGRGLTLQRNAGVRRLTSGAQYVVFLDDDVVLHPTYLAAAARAFVCDPDLVAVTGNVLLDGVRLGREVSRSEAAAVIREAAVVDRRRPTRELYGCNFAVRSTVLDTERFDERLPLYGWLEDRDFAGRVARHGKVLALESCMAVHRGANSGGRLSHCSFGYSQVMNAVYLRWKGGIGRGELAQLLVKGLPLNIAFLLVGRRRPRSSSLLRLFGNVRAYRDLAVGRITPERAAEL